MATNLRLDYELAKAQADIVSADADAIDTILKTLVSEVEANVNNANVWSGVSANDFLASWNKCADNFKDFVAHINTIHEKIEYTAQQVSAFDQQ